jgi:hypothetical protein
LTQGHDRKKDTPGTGGEDDMINGVTVKRSIVVILSAAILSGTGIANAFDMCRNIFGKTNHSELRNGYRDRFYGYAPPGYGYGGPPVHSYSYYPYRSERPESALEILDKRHARGEIDKQEYEEKTAAITGSR